MPTIGPIFVDSGVAMAKAALAEIELAAQVDTYGAMEITEKGAEYIWAFLKAMMKQEAPGVAAAKMSVKSTGRRAFAGT